MKDRVWILMLGMFVLSSLSIASAERFGDLGYTMLGSTVCITQHTAGCTTLVIPPSIGGAPIGSIGAFAFSKDTNLTCIVFPASVTNIENWPFEGCDALTSITVVASNPYYSTDNGVLFDKERKAIVQFPRGRKGSYEIPNTVTSIGNGAFWFSNLTHVVLPDSVTNLGERVFFGSSVKELAIPSSVTRIRRETFMYAEELTNVTLAAGVVEIEPFAFCRCGLTSVILPATITKIGEEAFCNCTRLTTIDFLGNAPVEVGPALGCNCNAKIRYLVGMKGWRNELAGYPVVACRILTVNRGMGGGFCPTGEVTAITANMPPGATFMRWVGATQYLANASALTTTLRMPDVDVSLSATYSSAAEGQAPSGH